MSIGDKKGKLRPLSEGLATEEKQDAIITAIGSGGGGGIPANKVTDAYGYQAKSVVGTDKYFFYEDGNGNWYVLKLNSSSVATYTKGTGGYASVYVDSTSAPSGSPTFDTYDATFDNVGASSLLFDAEGHLQVVVSPVPPLGVADKRVVWSQFFTDDGTPVVSGGSEDMRVNGSVTPVEFWIPAHPTRDRYVSSVFFLIADASATLSKFGNITALTNGIEFFYERDDIGEQSIPPFLMQSNFDFIRLSGGQPAFGDNTTSFRAANVVGSSEAFMADVDFNRIFGMPHGMRLRAGTNQRVVIRINDDITGVDAFTCRATGFERLPD